MRGKRESPKHLKQSKPDGKLKKTLSITIGITLIVSIGIMAAAKLSPPKQAMELPEPETKTLAVTIEHEESVWQPSEKDVELLAKTIWGEAGVVPNKERQAAVAWCVLNRVDSPEFPSTIEAVITAPHQFSGYSPDNPFRDDCVELAKDVLQRWHDGGIARTLPEGWCYFTGDGSENYFTKEWKGTTYWDWSLPNPYEETEE